MFYELSCLSGTSNVPSAFVIFPPLLPSRAIPKMLFSICRSFMPGCQRCHFRLKASVQGLENNIGDTGAALQSSPDTLLNVSNRSVRDRFGVKEIVMFPQVQYIGRIIFRTNFANDFFSQVYVLDCRYAKDVTEQAKDYTESLTLSTKAILDWLHTTRYDCSM